MNNLQSISASDARNNFSKHLKSVVTSQEPLVIEKGKTPLVVIIPYNQFKKPNKNSFKNLLDQVNLFRDSQSAQTESSVDVLKQLRHGEYDG